MAAKVQSATQVVHHFPAFGAQSPDCQSPFLYPNTQHPQPRLPRHPQLLSSSWAKAGQVALPVRQSHPEPPLRSRFNAPVQGASAADDLLRRKTPNGTLVGAYNGTFAESDSRQPPAKHLLADSRQPLSRRISGSLNSLPKRSSVVNPGSGAQQPWQISSASHHPQADSILTNGSPFYSAMDWQYTQTQPHQLIPPLQAPVGPHVSGDSVRGFNFQQAFDNRSAWSQQIHPGYQSPANADMAHAFNPPLGSHFQHPAQNCNNPFTTPPQVGWGQFSPQPIQSPNFYNTHTPTIASPPIVSSLNTFALDFETPEQVLQKGYLVYKDLISATQRARMQQNGNTKPARTSFPSIPSRLLPGHSKKHVHHRQPGSVFTRWKSESDLQTAGYNIVHALNKICQQGNSDWIEAMLLNGCVSFVLGEHDNAILWYSRIYSLDSKHVEAVSNLAASHLAKSHRKEAEHYWRVAIRLRPTYFEAVEQLVAMLCKDRRHREAIGVVDHVQATLRYDPLDAAHSGLQQFPTNRYSSAPADNGRLMALIHAKGNLLYNLHQQAAAAQAFEEVVLVAAGFVSGGIKDLMETIVSALSCFAPSDSEGTSRVDRDHLLLPPEKALQTARLCFPTNGDLPGLIQTADYSAYRSAISLTSNSLLSLAKVFQDGMNPSSSQHSGFKSIHGMHHILALYYLSLSLQPSPSTANNVGILLASVPQAAKGSNDPPASSPFPFPGVVPGSGIALALTYYKYGLNLDMKHAHLYTNLGSLLKDIGQLPIAVQMYEKAVQCDGSFDIALANLANAVKDQGKVREAIKYYQKAVEVNPGFSEAVCGLANALNSVCDWKGRGGVKPSRGSFDRWHVTVDNELRDSVTSDKGTPGWISRVVDVVANQLVEGRNWGRGLLTDDFIHHLSTSLASYGTIDPTRVSERQQMLFDMMMSWKGRRWEGARIVWLIERASKWISWQWYLDKYFRGRALPDSEYLRPRLPEALPIPGAPTVLPFHTFTLPVNAKQVRLISQRNGLRVSTSTLRLPWLPTSVFRPPRPPQPQIKVGYISSDFNNHPLAHLMQSVFGMHDQVRVTAYCYATTSSDHSSHREKIEKEAPHFFDASGWSVERLVKQIVADGIHILVNLNGYTRGARNEVFAARPAPIQMSFMGFAGTLGAEWCDYLLADEVAVPQRSLRDGRRNIDPFDMALTDNATGNEDWVYAENIIYTRFTFFCCDHRQSAIQDPVQEQRMTWTDEQHRRWRMRKELFPNLPDDAVILGNFNQLYKIDPTTLRTWLRILSRVDNAYLWLLRFPADGQVNLMKTARQWAGDAIASRILFTDVAPKQVHIARGCIADLFLDTPECNAHTTAADCLWSGTPLLTLPRYDWKMCSRMAASILGGALDRSSAEGKQAWADLVAQSEDDYEERAVRLASGLSYSPAANGVGAQGRLVELRHQIWRGRWTCDLFDTKRWVRDLETAYDVAWRRWVGGEGGDIHLREICQD